MRDGERKSEERSCLRPREAISSAAAATVRVGLAAIVDRGGPAEAAPAVRVGLAAIVSLGRCALAEAAAAVRVDLTTIVALRTGQEAPHLREHIPGDQRGRAIPDRLGTAPGPRGLE